MASKIEDLGYYVQPSTLKGFDVRPTYYVLLSIIKGTYGLLIMLSSKAKKNAKSKVRTKLSWPKVQSR